jgi:transcriptional regulator with XRE-family HTH domain
MPLGYSIYAAELVRKADSSRIGVALGLKCIERNVSVARVATDLGVTRQTVYNWFFGRLNPSPAIHDRVLAYLDTLN